MKIKWRSYLQPATQRQPILVSDAGFQKYPVHMLQLCMCIKPPSFLYKWEPILDNCYKLFFPPSNILGIFRHVDLSLFF